MVRRLGRARSSAVEHLTFNQRVDGSIPSGLTTNPSISVASTLSIQENDDVILAKSKRLIQDCAGRLGYRIVPRNRDAFSLRSWLRTKPIQTIVDVGASTGETATEWLKHFPKAIVHAIEPLPSSYFILEDLQKQNQSRLKVYNYAVGNEVGRAEFRMHPDHNTSSSLLLRTELSANLLPETEKEVVIDVAVTTLDALFGDAGNSMRDEVLVKLDVQGSELAVIRGASQFLNRVRYFLTEVSIAPVYNGQSGFNEIHSAMTVAGFEFGGFLEQVHLDNARPLYADVLYIRPTT